MTAKRILALLLALLLLCGSAGCRREEQASAETTKQRSDPPAETGETTPDAPVREMPVIERAEPDGSYDETFTVMIYMIGSDLESRRGCATTDLEEITASGVDLSRVNVLVYAGGCSRWQCDISTEVHTVLRLTQNGFETVTTFPDQSMGEADSLTRFLDYACKNAPADNYGLIFWDHGNGPVMGFGKDELHDSDGLMLSEMDAALAASPFRTKKLAFVGFDACLMSSAELICTLAPYADYMISSQETEPGIGWDYRFLDYCGRLPAKELANNIVADYFAGCDAYYAERGECSDLTLSVVDLSCGPALAEAINALFLAAKDDVSGDYTKLAYSRVHSRAFGRASTGSEYDLIDLYSLMEQMQELYPEQTAAIFEIIDGAVTLNASNTADCCGISLFYPYYNKTYYDRVWRDDYQSLDVFPRYSEYLTRFSQVWMGTDMGDAYSDLADPEAVTNSTFTLQLNAEQQECFASAGFYLLRRVADEQYALVTYSDQVTEKNGLLTAEFDGRVPYITTGQGNRVLPFLAYANTVGTVSEYVCHPIYEKGSAFSFEGTSSQTSDMILAVDHSTGEVLLKGLYEADSPYAYADASEREIGDGKRPELDPTQWEIIELLDTPGRYFTRKPDGTVADYQKWPQAQMYFYETIPAQSDLSFSFEPIYNDGFEYFIMFDIMDVQGEHCSSELLPVQLADEPETEQAEKEIDWQDGSKVVLEETDEFELSLQYLTSPVTCGSELYFCLENRSEEQLKLFAGDLLADGNNYCSTNLNFSLLTVAPGTTEAAAVDSLSAYCVRHRLQVPQALSVILTVTSEHGIAMEQTAFSVSFGEKIEPAVVWWEFMDCFAEEQCLLETERMKVTLEVLGKQPATDSSNLCFLLKIENRSDQEATFTSKGLVINGCYIETDESVAVCAHSTAYLYDECDWKGVLTYNAISCYDITAISECSIFLGIPSPKSSYDQIYSLYPVQLSKSASQGTCADRGELLYEDDFIQLYLYRNRIKTYYDSSACWELLAVNKTDRCLVLDGSYVIPGQEEGDSAMWSVYLPPNCATRIVTYACPAEKVGKVSLQLRSNERRSDIEYASALIELPVS